MPFASRLTTNDHQATGNFDSVASGSSVNGTSLTMNRVMPGSLAAHALVDAETSTFTIALNWQVSEDGSTWVDLAHESNNPSAVVLATGTAGADAAVTKVVPAPAAAYSYPYVRAILTAGGTTGTTSDTYTLGYSYRRGSSF